MTTHSLSQHIAAPFPTQSLQSVLGVVTPLFMPGDAVPILSGVLVDRNPYLEAAGIFGDDPYLEQIDAAIEAQRRIERGELIVKAVSTQQV